MRINSLKNPAVMADKAEDKELKKACQDFETVFAEMLLKSMRATVPDSGLMGKQEGFYRDMLDQEYAKSISRQGGLGIADALYKSLARGQLLPANDGGAEKIAPDAKGSDVTLK